MICIHARLVQKVISETWQCSLALVLCRLCSAHMHGTGTSCIHKLYTQYTLSFVTDVEMHNAVPSNPLCAN